MSYPFIPYTPVSALEAEYGRERVIEMAEAYLEAVGPLRAPPLRVTIPPLPLSLLGLDGLSPIATRPPGGGPVTPDAGEPLPAPREGAPDLFPLRRWSWDEAESADTPPAAEPAPRTPVRPILSPRTPPGAPARPARPAADPLQLGPTVEAGPDAVDAAADDTNIRSPTPDNHLAHLMRTDPEHPLLCPRHQHIPRGTLGPSRNSSGRWGFYGPPPSSGCRICKYEAEDDRHVSEMWRALAEAERRPTPATVAATRAALQAYDTFHHGMGRCNGPMSDVERGLAAVERAMADASGEGEQAHYCGDQACEGDCGVLDCGCIDVCRGRCGWRWDR